VHASDELQRAALVAAINKIVSQPITENVNRKVKLIEHLEKKL
jgi:hypothetical protein